MHVKNSRNALIRGNIFHFRAEYLERLIFAQGDGKRRPIVQEANFEILNFY